MRVTALHDVRLALPGLVFPDAAWAACRTSDHAYDAFICALVARARKLDLTRRPVTTAEHEAAEVEGWIHVPVCTLADLG